eukprot:snap_masked-scaffold_54-processed-gene-1.36-mRNA-1 protein AED:1.00 eAED:1.00 QI:0/-1/0/0/-1/1/1/0/77
MIHKIKKNPLTYTGLSLTSQLGDKPRFYFIRCQLATDTCLSTPMSRFSRCVLVVKMDFRKFERVIPTILLNNNRKLE